MMQGVSAGGYCATLLLALVTIGNCKIPDYIHVCPHDHKNLSGCIIESIEALRPRLKEGIPELKVPSLEPLPLNNISFDFGPQSSRLATNLTNVKAWGASNFKILKLTPTLTKHGYNFRFEVIVPQIHAVGEYEIDSKILFVDLKGKGPFQANITDYHFECILKGKKIQRDAKNYLEFDKMKCNLVIGKSTIFLENLFDGNPVLGKATNDVINENSDILFNEIKPSILDSARQRFTDIANRITLTFTYEELFP